MSKNYLPRGSGLASHAGTGTPFHFCAILVQLIAISSNRFSSQNEFSSSKMELKTIQSRRNPSSTWTPVQISDTIENKIPIRSGEDDAESVSENRLGVLSCRGL